MRDKLNLQELIKAENLKEGDLVVFIGEPINYKVDPALYELYEINKKYKLLNDNGVLCAILGFDGTQSIFKLPTQKPERHKHADLYIEAVNDLSIKWQGRKVNTKDGYAECIFDETIYFSAYYEYRKKPSDKELEIERLESNRKSCIATYNDELLSLKKDHAIGLIKFDNAIKELKGDL